MYKTVLGCFLLALWVAGCATLRPMGGSGDREDQRQAMQYFIRAKVFESQGNFMAAIVALRNAADLDPSSPTIFAQLAYNYKRIDDLDMAAHFAYEGLKLDPSDVKLRRFLVQVLEREGAHEEAVTQIEILLTYETASWPLYRHLAYLYLETGQEERIGVLFEKLLKDSKTPLEIKVDIASVFTRVGERERAEAIYASVLSKNPRVEDAWLGWADLKLSQGERQQAMQIYRNAARQLPDSSIPLYYLARLIVAEPDLEEIIREETPSVLYRLGVVLSDAGKLDLAALLFKRVVNMQPDSVEGWLDLGRYYLYLEDYEQLHSVMQQAAEVMPDSSEIYLFWATALERGGRYDRATEVYEQGIAQFPDSVQLYLYWGLLMEDMDQWEEAIEHYQRALQVVGPDVELYLRWGICLGRLSRWQEALSRYEAASEVDAEHGQVWLHWGIALQQVTRWEDAIEKLNAAVPLLPDDYNVLFYLASCYERASRELANGDYFTSAVETFRTIIEANPEDAFALNYLGYMYAEKGINLEEAVQLLLRAIAIDPNNSAFLDSLGWAYFQLGDLTEAERYLDRAIEWLDEEEDGESLAIIYDHAGDIAQAQGRRSDARGHWTRALEFDPANAQLIEKLER